MKPEIVAEYLSSLKKNTGLTYEAIAEISKTSESTVKKLCLGTGGDPQMSTIVSIVYALGGSMDEMLNPAKSKDEVKETTILALKDSYEYETKLMKESYETQINNIRTHYEQHHEDLKENFEKRLADKREIIESYKEHLSTIKAEFLVCKIALVACVVIFITVLIAELANPNLGWFRY